MPNTSVSTTDPSTSPRRSLCRPAFLLCNSGDAVPHLRLSLSLRKHHDLKRSSRDKWRRVQSYAFLPSNRYDQSGVLTSFSAFGSWILHTFWLRSSAKLASSTARRRPPAPFVDSRDIAASAVAALQTTARRTGLTLTDLSRHFYRKLRPSSRRRRATDLLASIAEGEASNSLALGPPTTRNSWHSCQLRWPRLRSTAHHWIPGPPLCPTPRRHACLAPPPEKPVAPGGNLLALSNTPQSTAHARTRAGTR